MPSSNSYGFKAYILSLKASRPLLKLIILLGLSSSALAGCGIRGPLAVPPPIFGGDKADTPETDTTEPTATDAQNTTGTTTP